VFAEAAPGMIGLELCVPLLLSLVHDGTLSLGRFVDALTRAPANVVGLPQPRIKDGCRADLVLLDPNLEHTIDTARLRSKSKNTPFAGRKVKGRVMMTVAGGRVIFDGTSARPS